MSWIASASKVDSILHVSIRRDETVLVELESPTAKCREAPVVIRSLETSEASIDGVFVRTASLGVLRGLRFDVCQVNDDDELIVFKLFCVYDYEFLTKGRIQTFFNDILSSTKQLRALDVQWRYGKSHCCQLSFSNKLKQLKEECMVSPLADSQSELTAFYIEQNCLLLEEWTRIQAKRRQNENESKRSNGNGFASLFGRVRVNKAKHNPCKNRPSEDDITSQSTSSIGKDVSTELKSTEMSEIDLLRSIIDEKRTAVVLFDEEMLSRRFSTSIQLALDDSTEINRESPQHST